MATFSKQLLSGSTNGRNVKVAATATAGTLIHTADASAKDEVWAWATNTDTVDRKLTMEWGGTTSPDDLHELTIPAESGPVPIVPGWILTGGVVFRAFAAVANVININGFVNRIT
jgi:hypothetical protein